MIPQRTFGVNGAGLPALGFGISGPHATRLVSRGRTIHLIHQALDGGASLFDTAPFYGDGEAESRLGEALAGVRDGAFLCSKAGTAHGAQGPIKDFRPQSIVRSVEGSLKRLRTDRLDALLLHGPAVEDLNDAVLEALEALRRAGKIRFTGVCGRGAEIDAAITSRRFDLIMAPASPASAKPALARAASARAAGMGVLGIEIMSSSIAAWRAPRSFADFWYLARSARGRARAPRTSAAPSRTGAPLKDLEWALAGEACDCAVVTTTRSSNLAANIAAAERAGAAC